MAAASDSGPAGWSLHAVEGDRRTCWLCRRGVPARALFCPHCGAVQPGQAGDPFALFGLDRRFDLDGEALARHYATLQRMLTPERLAVKSAHERRVALDLDQALAAAYEILRDPLRRARCLLTLAGMDAAAPLLAPVSASAPTDPPDDSAQGYGSSAAERLPTDPAALDALVTGTADGAALDRVAHLALHEMESCIHALSTAFRAGRLGEAQAILTRLDALEATAARARSRRSALAATG